MARQKGMLNLSGNLEPLAGAPLDSRSITPTVADLYIASNWPYKYIGMKTTVTATGDTYRLVNLDVTQESSWVKEGGESGQTIQYDELPAASSSLAGEIYQYTGTTNLQYTNGYFYECVNDGGTYKWVQTNVQPGSSYNDFTGATSQAAGSHGLVPAPTTGDISKFLKGDGTWATVPMPSFDYSNTSPDAMNFSTDEKVIGTWIDGKPLYQKTVDCGALPNNNNKSIPYNINNVERFVYVEGVYYDTSDPKLAGFLPKVHSVNINQQVFLDTRNGNIFLSAASDQSSYSSYVTLRYTKTTDTAVASGEKIVGQWIDGKPVYEKTLSINTPTSTTEESHSIGVSIDKAISINAIIITPYGTNYCGSIYAINSFEKGIKFFVETNSNLSNPNSLSVYISQYSWMDLPCYVTIRYTKTT